MPALESCWPGQEEQAISSTTGSNFQPQPKLNKTDTTAGEAADTQHTHVEDGGKANIKAEEAVNPKHTGITENRDKVHTKAEKSVNTRHTYLEKGSKLDVIVTAADVMNSFGEAAITLWFETRLPDLLMDSSATYLETWSQEGIEISVGVEFGEVASARIARGLSSCGKLASFLGRLYCTKGDR
jgi:hypothetical protein